MATAVGGGLGGMEGGVGRGIYITTLCMVEKPIKTTLCGRSAADRKGRTRSIEADDRSGEEGALGGGGAAMVYVYRMMMGG